MAKRNYISIRMEYGKINKYNKILKHNSRQNNVDYLLEKQNPEFKNPYENQFYNFNKIEEVKEKRKFKPQKHENEIIESVVVFSEEQAKEYLKEDPEALLKISKKVAENIKKVFGFTPLRVDTHLDEGTFENGKPKYNFHSHIIFYNYDIDKQKTVLRTLKKSDFSKMQDIAEKSAKELGYDFKRGEKKEYTNAKHLKVREYREAKNNLNLVEFLENQIKKIDEKKEKIRKNLNNNKKQIKLINKQLTAKKRIYQKELKEIKKNINGYDIDTTKEKIKNIFEKVYNQNAEIRSMYNHEKILKPEHIKFLFNDTIKELEKDIENNFFNGNYEKPQKLKKENEKLKAENEKKENELKEKEKELKNIKTEYELLSIENDILKKENEKKRKKLFEYQKIEKENNRLKIENERKTEIIKIIQNKNNFINENYKLLKKEYEQVKNNFNELKEANEQINKKFQQIKNRTPYIKNVYLRKNDDIIVSLFKLHLNLFIDIYNGINKIRLETTFNEIKELQEKKKELKIKISEDFENINKAKQLINDTKKEKEELKIELNKIKKEKPTKNKKDKSPMMSMR